MMIESFEPGGKTEIDALSLHFTHGTSLTRIDDSFIKIPALMLYFILHFWGSTKR